MTTRSAAMLAAAVLLVALAGVLFVTTPADPAPAKGRAGVSRDFSADQVSRQATFYRQLRPWSVSRIGFGLVITLLLGLTPLGARLVGLVRGHWAWQAAVGALLLTLVIQVVTLPLSARAEVILRRFGLSTQDWPHWWADVAKGWAVSAVLTVLAVLVFFGVAKLSPSWWWAWLAGASAAVVFALSFLYPVLFEPIFNDFAPMEHSALRQELVELAARDGVPVRDVLVADASRRTTALNAYVSGYGPSRRIVVYDTLLRSAPPEEVKLVVAHELGHAKYGDVLRGTVAGALGAALSVCVLFFLLGWQGLLARSGAGPGLTPRALALIMALAALAALASSPLESWLSRRTEARADEHALELTRDPATFIEMQRRLAVSNIGDLDPPAILYALYATHPTGPERIAHARDFARREHIELAATR